MQQVSTSVTANAQDNVSSITKSNDDLIAENKALQDQVNQLNQKLVDYYQYKTENAQFKNFLKLKQDNPDFELVSGTVIGRDPSNTFYSFTVDQGTNAGVKVNDPVITDAGVVGRVSKVSSMYCEVTTILSPTTNIATLDKVNRETGVTSSNIKLSDQNLLKMGYLESKTTVAQGDIVVTSGVGGLYPKNLAIGMISAVAPDENDVSLSATIVPFVDVKTVKDIVIITSFQGQGEVLQDFTSSLTSSTSSGGN